MNNTWVIGDIHGAHKALVQVLERSGFDRENDTLITLGDICDGWSGVYECVEELLTIKNRIDIQGNHDEPFKEFINTGIHPWKWKSGGDGTLKSYINNYVGNENPQCMRKMDGWLTSLNPVDIPLSHQYFFNHQIKYYIDEHNRLFIHGGFNRHFPIKEQNPEFFTWDRDLWAQALSFKSMSDKRFGFKMADKFSTVFLGHTTTNCWGTDEPMEAANIINLDTGAGFKGKLTLWNLATSEYVQSDKVADLYPNEIGRN